MIDADSEIRKLKADLLAAKDRYDAGGDGRRHGAYFSLQAVTDYLSALGIDDAALSPLRGLAWSLADADRGILSPIFAPKKTAGAPGKRGSDLSREQVIAVIAECCVRHFRNEGARPFVRPAIDRATRMVNQAHPEQRMTFGRVRDIRENVQQLRGGDQGRALYDELIAHSLVDTEPLEWATAILNQDWQ